MTAQILLSLIVGLSVLALFNGLRVFMTPSGGEDRLQEVLYGSPDAPMTLREIELRTSFVNRTIKPMSKSLLQWLGKLAPQRNAEALQRKLDMAGNPGNLGIVDFLGLKLISGLIIAVLLILFVMVVRTKTSMLMIGFVGLSGGLAGFMIPNYWLIKRIAARKHEILKSLPDALDMMVICVDAGMGLSGAMQRICDNWNNALVEEFARVLTETKLGRSRPDSLEAMAHRTGVKEMISFVMALTMAERLGASIAQVLHVQAEQMRIARRQRAEQLAREASIKMLFPLVFLIFPAMFAVILGPAVPQLLETFGSL
ncbi:MAG TPA: type II secretion system F family protein [Anaerolineae bacterium]|mgnify:CR=1 FL=1|nr:type II secretion system F family protein [Anaerolineae bacterium]MCB0222283.1 type II secretion system F family protein [Anaerolineae bacterium]MCB9103833.1 type II secretion system F family protein [Anaerolineales bacterium]HRV96258.1 type II secretion system F family protein [Anaerolineae bacterium]